MIKKSYAKLNIFLKIVGTRGRYHEISSRFVQVKNLFDIVEFIPKTNSSKSFELEGNFGCMLEANTVYKAFLAFKNSTYEKEITDFFACHKVTIKKNIPEFAGLGGGSSNAAAFLLLANEVLGLGASKKELAKIGVNIGADIPFFIYEYESANVGGIGEIVEPFSENLPEFELVTPSIKCETRAVFEYFRENYFDLRGDFSSWHQCSSKSLLETFSPLALNDLYKSSLELYSQLLHYYDEGWFMSGSGSSVFRIKNG